MSILEEGLAAEFIAAGYTEYSDSTRMPSPQEYANLARKVYIGADKEHAYTIQVRVYDMHRLSNYPRIATSCPRWIFEAHIQYYGSTCEGLEPVPTTNVSFVVESVMQTENHARRMWIAMGQTTE